MQKQLEAILAQSGVCNEEGEPLTDFANQGRDCLDFASVGRDQLQQLMQAAYEAGRSAK
jgi:hypothetical protein